MGAPTTHTRRRDSPALLTTVTQHGRTAAETGRRSRTGAPTTHTRRRDSPALLTTAAQHGRTPARTGGE
ncbi:hypothetical protein [Streptomyces sp. CB02400]|uniref:hypothetical protein n=1 Tax=Streptomyces sp. CB02400 TaxID=1703944 RepID=UPI000939808F|nr:hypothetical protein [Streptomyces sp. CB02400]OKK12567.1 hypothetical protein AMK33_06715 [Streptomyces sp. CB02400]